MAHSPPLPRPRAASDYLPAGRSTHSNSHTGSWAGFAVLIVAYKFLLDISYVHVADAFGYQGLFRVSSTARTEVMSWVMLLVALPAFKKVFDDRSASGNVLSLLILFSVIPSITVMSFRGDYELSYVGMLCLYWALLFIAWSLSKTIHIPSLRALESSIFYLAIAAALSITVVIYSYLNTGLRLHFNIIEVYDIRAEAREFAAPFGINYIVSLADNILPVLAVFVLAQRRWIIFAALCLVIFINFSITGTKQLLFVPFFGVAGYYAIKDFGKTYRLVAAALIFTAACIMEILFSQSIALHTLFTYRVLFIPSELHYSYYSYFQVNDLLYYSQSLFRLYQSATQENIQFLIGEYSIGDYTARANNGLFSDAYMNLGLVGILVYPFIIVLFLRILDGAITGLPQRMVFVIVVYVAFVLLGMTLTSALLTSGLMFLIFLLYSLPRHALRDEDPALPVADAPRSR